MLKENAGAGLAAACGRSGDRRCRAAHAPHGPGFPRRSGRPRGRLPSEPLAGLRLGHPAHPRRELRRRLDGGDGASAADDRHRQGCAIVSVDYRLAPKTRPPGAVEDCYAALSWIVARAGELGIDASHIGVMGESAGGGLAAALALLTCDRGKHRLAFQHLIYPMLDDRTAAFDDPHPVTGEYILTSHNNNLAGPRCSGTRQVRWRCHLTPRRRARHLAALACLASILPSEQRRCAQGLSRSRGIGGLHHDGCSVISGEFGPSCLKIVGSPPSDRRLSCP